MTECLHKRQLLNNVLDNIHTHDSIITNDNRYIMWIQNDCFSFAWIDLNSNTHISPTIIKTSQLDTLCNQMVWVHYTADNLVQGEPIVSYKYTNDDSRVYLLTSESEPRIFIINLNTAVVETCLIANSDQWVCRFFINIWPRTGHRMITLYCMDNVLYSYRIDNLLKASTSSHQLSSHTNMDIHFIKEKTEFSINGWVYRYLPLIMIRGCCAAFHDGYQLCIINLDTCKWLKPNTSDNIRNTSMYCRVTKRMALSSDEKYIYVIFFNGTISQYRISNNTQCIAHYNIKLHPFSRTPLPWPTYTTDNYLDNLNYYMEPNTPIIIIRPPLLKQNSGDFFISHNDLETIADSKYGSASANTWRILDTENGRIIYKNRSQYIQTFNFIKSCSHRISYRCADKIINIANLDMPLTRHTYIYFPLKYQRLITRKYIHIDNMHDVIENNDICIYDDWQDVNIVNIIKKICTLPFELIEVICQYITLTDVI